MSDNTNEKLSPTLAGDIVAATFGATLRFARVEKGLPDAYRLVSFRTEEGQTHLKLQGYFTWQQGYQHGGEWKDIETVDADDLSDDKPYGPLG